MWRWIVGAMLAVLVMATARVPSTDGRQTMIIMVPSMMPWTDTGIDLAPSTRINVTATGEVDWGCPECRQVSPAGLPCDRVMLVPSLPCWSLMARVDGGPAREVGSSTTFVVMEPGRLFLGMNDEPSRYQDNRGAFTATVILTPPEVVSLDAGCTNITTTWSTAILAGVVAAAVSPPSAVESLWRLDNARGQFLGFAPGSPMASNLMEVAPLDVVFICMNAAGSFARPAP